jgi:prepilin-type N-terminal cleavage/methylation domain-containing protein
MKLSLKEKSGFTLLELMICVVMIGAVIGIFMIFTGGNKQTSTRDTPFFETEEGRRNRMLERQAEAMERQNELAEEALKLQRTPERR